MSSLDQLLLGKSFEGLDFAQHPKWSSVEMLDTGNREELLVFLEEMGDAITRVGIANSIFTLTQVLVILPFNIINVFLIVKNSELWTQLNAIMVLNSIWQTV